MSWHYLQGQEVACWDQSSLVGAPDALSSLVPSAAASCSAANEMVTSSHSPSGTMSAPSTVDPGVVTSTSSPEAFPADRFRLRAEVDESHLISGQRCSVSSKTSNRGSCSLRTSSANQSEEPQKTSSVTAIHESRLPKCPPPQWVRRITGRVGGYLPTPTAKANAFAPSMAKWPAYQALQTTYGPSQGPRFWEMMMAWPIGWTGLRAIGNGQVPAVAQLAWTTLTSDHNG